MDKTTNQQSGQTQLMEIARQEVWNKTPFSYIRSGAKLTLLQTDTMLMVSDHLQQYVKEYFDLGLNRADAKPRALFSKYLLEHGIPPFKIYLADMGINPSHYKSVREAIEEMNILVDHPELDDNGRPTGHIVYSPVFTKFRVPQTGDFYRKTDDQGKIVVDSARHYGYVEVEINKDVAQYAFDMSQGYANHPKLIARYASKQSTPKLYFKLLELMGKDRRAKVRLTIPEIKKALGFEPFKDENTGEWVVPYQKFAHFKTKVLDAVKADLDRMARENHTDITFDYETVYLNGRKRGDPDCIVFTIMSTDLGMGYGLITGTTTPAIAETRQLREKARQLDLFQQQEDEDRQQQYAQRFAACQQEIVAAAKTDEARRIFASLHFEHYDEQTHAVLVQVASRTDYDFIESDKVLPAYVAHLRRHFGERTQPKYRILKEK